MIRLINQRKDVQVLSIAYKAAIHEFTTKWQLPLDFQMMNFETGCSADIYFKVADDSNMRKIKVQNNGFSL